MTTANPSAASPNDLLTRVAGEDRDAFRTLYERYAAALFGVCVRIVRDHDRASDVFQDAMVKIWANASRYDPTRGDAIAWMITLTRRCALDSVRRHARLPVPDANLAETTPDPSPPPESGDAARRLRDCLSRLDQHRRRVIVLAFVYGLTHEELSGRLGHPLGTVKSWLRRGMIQLKRCLQG